MATITLGNLELQLDVNQQEAIGAKEALAAQGGGFPMDEAVIEGKRP
jgi:hypothetical protein